jgi:prepilin-type N-terminal cleavage/methylation domain-containing protein
MTTAARSDRSAFTLVEVMVATVLTSVVALLAVAAAKGSVESQERLDASLRGMRSDRAVRQTLLDLLHNVRAPRRVGDTSLILTEDTLWLLAAGAPPLDPDYDWLVRLHPGPAGLEVAAASVGRSPSARFGFRVPRVIRWEVRMLPPGGSQWQREWRQAGVLPRGVSIVFRHDSAPSGPPLTVRLTDALPSGWVEEDAPVE